MNLVDSNYLGLAEREIEKGREKFVAFMQAKRHGNEWKSHLKEAIRHYEVAERTCKVTTKTKRFYLLKSKIFKALSNCHYNLYSYSRSELNDVNEWFDHEFIKDSLFNAVKYGCDAIEVGYGAWPESWIDENCSKLYQRVMEIQNLMTPIINWNQDEITMTTGLRFLEGCALQLPDNFLQLKNSLLIEIMQQLNQLAIESRPAFHNKSLPEYNAIGRKQFEAMSGIRLTKIAKNSEQISHFIDPASLTDSQRSEFSVLEIEISNLLTVSDILQSLSIARNQLIDALGYEKQSTEYNAGIEMALDNFNYAYERSKGEEEKLSVIISSEMANVFDIYDQRPKSKSKATEYFTWSLTKIRKENWDANVSFYWHKNAIEYCKKRHKDIFGAEEEKNKNDATYETRVLIEKISDLYQEFLTKGETFDGAVRFIKQVKQVAPPKVKKPAFKPFPEKTNKKLITANITAMTRIYHPDRNLIFGEQWHLLCKEISKFANAIYEATVKSE